MFIMMPSKRLVTIRGERERPVSCEQCGCDYEFKITRTAVGEDKSLFSWSENSAYAKAAKDAEKKLDELLEKEFEIAPCPDCGWVQKAMVDEMNAKSYLPVKNLALALFLIGFGVGGLLLIIAAVARPFNMEWGAIGCAIVAAAIMGYLSLSYLRNSLLRSSDPNRHFEPGMALVSRTQ